MRFSKSDVLGENRGSFVLYDAIMHSDNEGYHTECLLLHVDEADEEMKDKSSATFMTVLEWLSFTSSKKFCLVFLLPFTLECLLNEIFLDLAENPLKTDHKF